MQSYSQKHSAYYKLFLMSAQKTKSQQHRTALGNETKLCASCGRIFSYQKRWAKNWEAVRYCSSSCRQDKFEKRDVILEATILSQLNTLPKNTTISLSDIEKNTELPNIRNLKERLRRAVRRLLAKDKLDILQKGRLVDASTAKGDIELRLK